MSLSEQLTISIASKDRPEVVEATLRKIHAFGLGDCPLILCDDGSSPPLDPLALALFPHGRLIRNEAAQGQALARNRIAQECHTPFLLQLDDDSYPVAGSVATLLKIATREKDWLALAILFEEPARKRSFPEGIPMTELLQLRSFVGCAVLLHVENFLKIGGYATWIERTVEEEELCIRAHYAGLRIMTADGLRIRHDVTDVARDQTAIAYRSIRNWTMVWLIYAPLASLPVRLGRLFVASVQLSLKQRSMMPISGYAAAFRRFFGSRISRCPLNSHVYRSFLSSPHALDLYPNHNG
jgi:GT2 family glycosyltransferase